MDFVLSHLHARTHTLTRQGLQDGQHHPFQLLLLGLKLFLLRRLVHVEPLSGLLDLALDGLLVRGRDLLGELGLCVCVCVCYKSAKVS